MQKTLRTMLLFGGVFVFTMSTIGSLYGQGGGLHLNRILYRNATNLTQLNDFPDPFGFGAPEDLFPLYTLPTTDPAPGVGEVAAGGRLVDIPVFLFGAPVLGNQSIEVAVPQLRTDGAYATANIYDGTLGPPVASDLVICPLDLDDVLANCQADVNLIWNGKAVTVWTQSMAKQLTEIGSAAKVVTQQARVDSMLSSFGFEPGVPGGPLGDPMGVPLGPAWDATWINGAHAVTSWTPLTNGMLTRDGRTMYPPTTPTEITVDMRLSSGGLGDIPPTADSLQDIFPPVLVFAQPPIYFLDDAKPVLRVSVGQNFIQATWEALANQWFVVSSSDWGQTSTVAFEGLYFSRFEFTTTSFPSGPPALFDAETFCNSASTDMQVDIPINQEIVNAMWSFDTYTSFWGDIITP